MNMPSTACARHGALYVMVDTWAKSDCINGNTSLCVYGGDYDREQQGSTGTLGAPAAAAGRLPARVALSRAHCGLALWAAEPSHGRLGPRGAQPSSRRGGAAQGTDFAALLTTRYDLGQAKQRMTRHADFRGRYRFVQVRKAVCRGRRSVMKSLLSSPLAWHV